MNSVITGIGRYLPEKILTNKDFEKIVDTSDEWILQRTGIRERRIEDKLTNVEIGERAARDLSERYNKELSDVDYIIYACVTPEQKFPSLACQLQARLGIPNAGAIDISAACAGYLYAINMAKAFIASGMRKKILIVTSERLSQYTDYEDRTTCVLFGDAAAATLIEASTEVKNYETVMGSEGELGQALYCTDTLETLNGTPVKNNNKIIQDGRKVFKWAVERMTQKTQELLDINNLKGEDIDYFIPHSANLRIIDAICAKTGIDTSKTLSSLEMYGNTSAVTIPLAITMGLEEGKIKKGQKLLLIGFGGGLTYSGTVIEWGI